MTGRKALFASIHENLLKIGAIPLDRYLASDGAVLQPIWDVSSGYNKYVTPLGETKTIASFSQKALDDDEDKKNTDARPIAPNDSFSLEGGPIKRVHDCCMEWRAGLVQPYWVRLDDPKIAGKHGFALKIKLNAQCYRNYSVDIVYDSVEEAMQACATLAIDQGVLDFIKYGNGQTQPLPRSSEVSAVEPVKTYPSVQSFLSSYHKQPPFPGGVQGLTDFSPAGWLHQAIQMAHGKLQIKYIPISEYSSANKLSPSYGCVLRLTRPATQPLTFILEPVMENKSDIKGAVCLEAISQGVAEYIASVVKEVGSKVSSEMRQLGLDRVFPVLSGDLKKIPGAKMTFAYSSELDAVGCTLAITLAEENPTSEEIRSFTVPPDFKNKNDAKVAVLCLAAEQGVVEFVRFRRLKLPPGYVAFPADTGGQDASSTATSSKKGSKKRKAKGDPRNPDPGKSSNKKQKHDRGPAAGPSRQAKPGPAAQSRQSLSTPSGPRALGGPMAQYYPPDPYAPPGAGMHSYPPGPPGPFATQFAPMMPFHPGSGPGMHASPSAQTPPARRGGPPYPGPPGADDRPRYSFGYR